MVFASYLYAGDVIGGPVVVRDDEHADWAMGLWFAAPDIETPRLLAAPEGGMVLPLALSPDGAAVAAWWLPERTGYGQPQACESGIYVVATDGTGSRLVERGDWSIPFAERETAEYNWRDPDTGASTPRRYMLPAASFSADGKWLAIIDGTTITLTATGPDPTFRYSHTGSCPNWGWSPVGATFVAGCEDMTSAWLVADLSEGNGPSSLALPAPRIGDLGPGWEVNFARAIGLTRDGNIRVARFYGYATGCEAQGCTLPDPGFVVSTIDPVTSAATTRSGTVSFLADYDRPTHFSADATWVYTNDLDGEAHTIRIGLGTISTTRRLETYAGAAFDGSVLYGSRVGDESRIDIESVNRDGKRVVLTSISWPATIETTFQGIRIEGLQVAKPS